MTFAELAAGSAVQWFFTVNATSDYGDDSFWTFCWTNAGQDVDFTFKPYGNATASTPSRTSLAPATSVSKPPVGGTAGEMFTFETRLDVAGTPARVTL